jgi:hypothetical protein
MSTLRGYITMASNMTPATRLATEMQAFINESRSTSTKSKRNLLDIARVTKGYIGSISLHVANCNKRAQQSGVTSHKSHDKFPADIDTQLEYITAYMFIFTQRKGMPKVGDGDRTIVYKTLKSLGERMWQVASSNRQPDAPPFTQDVYYKHTRKVLQNPVKATRSQPREKRETPDTARS